MTLRRSYGGGGGGSGGGSGGAQTLTGDATGTLSGTNIATTVVAAQGNPIASGVPTTGGFWFWSGATWTPSTKLLYTDTAGTLSWIASASPLLTQATPTTDVATSDMQVTPQAPFASAVTNVSPAHWRLNLAAPISGTNEAALDVYRAGTKVASLGMFPGGAGQGTLWLGQASPSTTNYAMAANANFNINAAVGNLNLRVSNNSIVSLQGTGEYVGNMSAPTGVTTGSNILGLTVSAQNPTAGGTSGSNSLYSDSASKNLKNVDSLGTFTALSPASSGTITTQKAQVNAFIAYTSQTTSGSAVTLSVPLATSTTTCSIQVRVIITIATPGSLNAAGDSYISDVEVGAKNVAGTVTIVGTAVSLFGGNDASLSTSTVVLTGSGTNIVITVTPTASAGTLGTAKVTIYVPEQVVN